MSRLLPLLTAFTVAVALPGNLPGEEPLHVRIDRVIDAARIGPQAPPATDAEFLRRTFLDLTGSIPTSAEARRFLDDPAPDKRARLIDTLLDSPGYVRHLTATLAVMLMERRTNAGDWQAFLQASVAENKPWNRLAAKILAADGVDPKTRGPAQFYLARNVEPDLLTRDVGRVFFGLDVQCAQCHDHPSIDDYLQADYYGLYAFLSRTYAFKDKKTTVLAEKAEGEVTFKSVFTAKEGETRPRLPGDPQIDEPTFKKGEEYAVKPDKKGVRPVPKYSRREQLGRLAAEGKNQAFRRNIANRLWGLMMGRGIVHPPDLHHAENPPSHPKLLDLLADEFAAMKFDIKAFLREVALTKVYQRSAALPEDLAARAEALTPRLERLQADRKALTQAWEQTDHAIEKARTERDALAQALAAGAGEVTKAGAAVAAARKAQEPLAKAVAEVRKQLADRQAVVKPLAESLAKAREALKAAPDDRELAGVAEKWQQQVTQRNDEVAALTKTLAGRTEAERPAADQLAKAEATLAGLTARQAETRKQLDEADQRLAALRDQSLRQRAAVLVAERRALTIEALKEYTAQSQAAAASQAALVKAQEELLQVRSEAEKAQADLTGKRQELAAVQQAHTEAAKKVAETKEQLDKQSAIEKTVAEAAAKAGQARQALPGDADLEKAAEILTAKARQLSEAVTGQRKALAGQESQVQEAATKIAEARKGVNQSARILTDLEKRSALLAGQIQPAAERAEADRQSADEAYAELTRQWSEQFVIATLEPLSPEQMAWSVMQATGLLDRQRAAEAAALSKKKPLTPEEQKDPAKRAAREREVEQAAAAKLQGNVGVFVNLFGAGAGQPQYDFFATAEQALFFANGSQLRSWLTPAGGNLTDRLNKIAEPDQLAEELFLSVLTRRPTAGEVAEVKEYLALRPKEKAAAVQELAWALLTSNEFRFQH